MTDAIAIDISEFMVADTVRWYCSTEDHKHQVHQIEFIMYFKDRTIEQEVYPHSIDPT